jgi:hypothetical protein
MRSWRSAPQPAILGESNHSLQFWGFGGEKMVILTSDFGLLYDDFFQSEFAQVAIEDHGLRLIVYDPVQEVIEQWIN